MAKKKPSPKVNVAAQPASRGGIGWRWHPARFRMALWLVVAAIGLAATFGQSSALVMWFLRDAYVATRATVVKAPYWADALSKEADPYGSVAGWYVDLQVADKPFTLAVAMSDFDPGKNSADKNQPPSPGRFSVGNVHPVWFMVDQQRIAARTVSLISEPPPLLISRAEFPHFPTLDEAIAESTAALTLSAALLVIAVPYLILAFVGRRNDITPADAATRASVAFVALLIAAGIFMLNREHPLAANTEQYVPAEIEIVTLPFAVDQLTHYSGYRVVWRTWRVEARLVNPDGPAFFIDVDGLDPRRVTWASRHSPDFDAFKPGTRMKVWQ
ncbi:MAG: hypothetical protein JNJ55_02180, partial [Betaproteobacteria bacterium]|nr:hypothetical protein [Betaproteobacteria bacterium]